MNQSEEVYDQMVDKRESEGQVHLDMAEELAEVALGSEADGVGLDSDQKELLDSLLNDPTITISILRCTAEAKKKGIEKVDFPDEFKDFESLLCGVRVDECGVVADSVIMAVSELQSAKESGDDERIAAAKRELDVITNMPEYLSINGPDSTTLIGGIDTDSIVSSVGTFNSNNGIVQYVNERGEVYVAPSTRLLLDALLRAKYKQDGNMYVNLSNGESLANGESVSQFELLNNIRRTINACYEILLAVESQQLEEKYLKVIPLAIKKKFAELQREPSDRAKIVIKALAEIREGVLRYSIDKPRLTVDEMHAIAVKENTEHDAERDSVY